MLMIPSYSSHYAHLMLKWRKTSLLSWQFSSKAPTRLTFCSLKTKECLCWDLSITNNNIMAISTWTANLVWSIDELKQVLVSSSQGLMQHIPYVNGSCCLRHLTYCLELVQNTATHLEFPHTIQLLCLLHWLSVAGCIQFNPPVLAYRLTLEANEGNCSFRCPN